MGTATRSACDNPDGRTASRRQRRPGDGSQRAERAFDAGLQLHQAGELGRAVALYRRALSLQPDSSAVHANLGSALRDLGQAGAAIAHLRAALRLTPGLVQAHNNLGIALRQQERLDEAVSCFRAALELKPDYLEARINLGTALKEQGRLDEAVACFRAALASSPNLSLLHYNLGNTLKAQRRLDEAAACLRRAIELSPDHVESHYNLGRILLARGDMAAGWREYEWRWETPHMMPARRRFAQPQWRGEAGEGRTLLIHAEQGFGDTLQFCRYAPLAAARGLRVILQVPKPLIRLLRSLPGVQRLIDNGEEAPPFDLHCPMLSLPLALGTTLATIPAALPYLHADAAQAAAWRARLAASGARRPRVGLAWAGSATMQLDGQRSLTAGHLAPLLGIEGVHLISLQRDRVAAADVPLASFMDEMHDFADTAALVASLDLVISVDTAVAHLAGALGKPVWLLDRFDPCWRWLDGRLDSPWYPSLRIYRQPRPADWGTVLAEAARDLSGGLEPTRRPTLRSLA